ncbi:MAG TPA: hypothetical protein VNZ02_09720 [Steroidobacteraceae bacterium]|jgi:uncharacterized membrane protein|nr:hypothetical protein [Steroidobacteraceae bacterium]
MHFRARLQLAAVIVFLAAYSLLSHYGTSHPQAHDLGAALALAPLLTIGLVLIWRWGGALQAFIAAAAAWFLLRHYWPLLTQHFIMVVLIQQCGLYAIMAVTFGSTLRGGRVPLCTQLATKVHAPLTVRELKYTRSVTVAWVVFFLLNLAATLLIYEFAPLRIWSLFVNFCTFPLILLMFVAEYAVRRVALPRGPRGLMATLRVYFANPP